MKVLIILLYLALSVFMSQPIFAKDSVANADYARCIFSDSMGNTMPYRMLSPSTLDQDVKYPLIIFLHGYGERGDDNEKQLTHGASLFSNPVNMEKYPAFVIFPQCSERSWTYKFDEKTFMPRASTPPESKTEEIVVELINDILVHNPVDSNRIYLVGMSMGGIATYDLVCRYPELFSAAVPICGAVNPDRLRGIKNVGFLIFHGGEDNVIPVRCSREAYKTLSAIGAVVNYVEFAGVGHDCWSSAFNYPSFLPWLFSQTKENMDVGPHDPMLTYTK